MLMESLIYSLTVISLQGKNQKYCVAMTSMSSHVWTPKVNEWHGLHGGTLTCHGIKQNSWSAILVKMGGPTDEARGILNLSIQYWTSRGWAFLDVNYGGSTGYGRAYRECLLGRWGIVDVNDCCSCARYLVEKGKADGERICITGCSAGGYTTLAALAFRDTFKAGNDKDCFERSPINFVDRFSCPMILFQGLDDKVVFPDQARKIHKALKEKGLPVALVEYEGEQHGFHKAESIRFTLEQAMVFFARLIGHFKVADEITPMVFFN